MNTIQRFLEVGMRTNIHYVLGNDSIDEAIWRLETNDFPQGINAVIFLLYKPVGKVKDGNVLSISDPRVARFYQLIETPHPFRCGLDACHMPGVVNMTSRLLKEAMSPCDAARFSMYVTPDGFALPCSFDTTQRKWAVDLRDNTIQEAWESEAFTKFRRYHALSCTNCKLVDNCLGGCPLMGNEINLCQRGERKYHEIQK
jgi:radical SAM protein with 4Fe4S-binding SPASM domain